MYSQNVYLCVSVCGWVCIKDNLFNTSHKTGYPGQKGETKSLLHTVQKSIQNKIPKSMS